MPDIIPRWEWRTFDPSDQVVVRQFSALTAERMQVSDEVYLLSPVTDANVKIRDELMDVKTLEAVSDDGLEQWRPVMKATFPLGADDVRSVCRELGVAAPATVRDATTLDELRADLEPMGVRAVPVHKVRLRYVVDGAMAEMTEVTSSDHRTRTVAVESEDPARVHEALVDLELTGLANTSYPRGLKHLIGMR